MSTDGQKSTESFGDWLKEQADRDDEVGTLAKTVVGDSLFPEHGDRNIYEGYFTSDSEPADAKADFDRAWDEFENSAESA